MSVFFLGSRVKFIRENWLQSIHFCSFGAWDRALVRLSGGKVSQIFWLFNVFKTIKQLKMALKKLYSWPKKLYQFITNLFFLANMLISGSSYREIFTLCNITLTRRYQAFTNCVRAYVEVLKIINFTNFLYVIIL